MMRHNNTLRHTSPLRFKISLKIFTTTNSSTICIITFNTLVKLDQSSSYFPGLLEILPLRVMISREFDETSISDGSIISSFSLEFIDSSIFASLFPDSADLNISFGKYSLGTNTLGFEFAAFEANSSKS